MKTRRTFIKGLFGFAGTILALGGFKKASGETKNSGISLEGQAAINAAGRCVPKGYTLDSESGLPELTERNLNIMINRQLKDFEVKNKGKIQIEYLFLLGGCANPLGIQCQDATQALTMVLEAPFIIYWDGWTGSRKDCPMGNVEINLVEIGDKRHLIRNLDIDKLTNWILRKLTIIPEKGRVRKYVVNEMVWVARLSLDTLKLFQKEKNA